MKKYILLYVFSIAIDALLLAQAGTPDPEFNGDGKFIYEPYEDKHAEGCQVLSYPGGKILVTGYTRVPGQSDHAMVIRLDSAGNFDHSFNGNGRLFIHNLNGHSYSYCSAIQPDGKIVVLVKIENPAGDSLAIYRFLPNGVPDNSFSKDGVEYFHFGLDYLSSNSLIIQPDGKFLVAGYTGIDTADYAYAFLARRMPNGEPDITFDGDGVNIFRMGESWVSVFDILLQNDGKIYIGGIAHTNGFEDFAAARFLPNGHLDNSFDDDGIVMTTFFKSADDGAYGAVLQPDGKLILAGYAGAGTPNGEVALVRYDVNGDPDYSFSGDGKLTLQISGEYDAARSVLLQPDGKIIVGGSTNGFNNVSDFLLARITPDGILDYTFGEGGVVVYDPGPSTDYIQSCAWEANGKILVSGTSWDDHHRVIVARFLAGELVKTNDVPVTLEEIQLYPNPASDVINVNYSLSKAESFAIHLYNAEGKFISNLSPFSSRAAGNHTEVFHLKGVLPGIYNVRIESPRWTKALKVVIN